MFFSDPDGNGWAVQQISARLELMRVYPAEQGKAASGREMAGDELRASEAATAP